MSTLEITTEGILKVNHPGFPDETYRLQAPMGVVWTLSVYGTTGGMDTQDAGIGDPVTLILRDTNQTPWQVTINDDGILSVQSFDQDIILAPVINAPVLLNGLPAVGYELIAFQGGTQVGVTTYKKGQFIAAQPSTIPLNDLGLPMDPIFIVAGVSYKFQLLPPGGGLAVKEWDHVVGGIPLNLTSATEWGPSFSATFRTTVKAAIQADVRSSFPRGRRLRAIQSSTIYHTVKQSTYNGTETIVEVEPGGTALASTLVTLEPSILSPVAPAVPSRRHAGVGTVLSGGLTIPKTQGLNILSVGTIAVHLNVSDMTAVGWLWCNGDAVSRTGFAALFAAIGTTYGSGNGTTTFNVPNITSITPTTPASPVLHYFIFAKG